MQHHSRLGASVLTISVSQMSEQMSWLLKCCCCSGKAVPFHSIDYVQLFGPVKRTRSH